MNRRKDLIPVAPIREAVEATDVTVNELAHKLGWVNRRGRVDTTRVRRALGMKNASPAGPQAWITPMHAARLLEAAGLTDTIPALTGFDSHWCDECGTQMLHASDSGACGLCELEEAA